MSDNDKIAKAIKIVGSNNTTDITGILDLQFKNLGGNQNEEIEKSQGFLTVHHNRDTLIKMKATYPHVVAKLNDTVVGYTLVMLIEFGEQVPELFTMFKEFEQIKINGFPLFNQKFMVMGQVCVAQQVRGLEVFSRMYKHLQLLMANDFDYIVTEIAKRNTRSTRAHENVGFKIIHEYIDPISKEDWVVVALPTK